MYTKTFTMPNGKRKYIRAKTKEELERRYTKAKLEMGAGVDVSDRTTVKELCELWLSFKHGTIREQSEQTLRHRVDCYIVPVIGTVKARDAKPVHINRVMQGMEGLSHGTKTSVLQILRSVFQLAVDNGLILKSPVPGSLKPGGHPARETETLTPEQSELLLAELKGYPVYTFILLALRAGLRRGELLGLQWGDIDFDAGTVTVNRNIVLRVGGESRVSDELKTKAANRTIPLPASVVGHLAEKRAASKTIWVFPNRRGGHADDACFQALWYPVTQRIASTPDELGTYTSSRKNATKRVFDFDVHPHQLRHTCITRWFEMGLDLKEIQYLAGHSNVTMTLSVYTHYDRKSREADTAAKIRAASS